MPAVVFSFKPAIKSLFPAESELSETLGIRPEAICEFCFPVSDHHSVCRVLILQKRKHQCARLHIIYFTHILMYTCVGFTDGVRACRKTNSTPAIQRCAYGCCRNKVITTYKHKKRILYTYLPPPLEAAYLD